MKGYVSKWEYAIKVAKTYNPMNATSEEIRIQPSIFCKIIVGMDTPIGRVDGKLVMTRHSPKPY